MNHQNAFNHLFADLNKQVDTLHRQYFNRLRSLLLASPTNAYLFGVTSFEEDLDLDQDQYFDGDDEDDDDEFIPSTDSALTDQDREAYFSQVEQLWDKYKQDKENPTNGNQYAFRDRELDRNYQDDTPELTVSLEIYRQGSPGRKGPLILAFSSENRHKRLEQLTVNELRMLVWQLDSAYTGEASLEVYRDRYRDNSYSPDLIFSQSCRNVSDAFDLREAEIMRLITQHNLHRTDRGEGLLSVQLRGKANKSYTLKIRPAKGLEITMDIEDVPNLNPIELEYQQEQESLKAILVKAGQHAN